MSTQNAIRQLPHQWGATTLRGETRLECLRCEQQEEITVDVTVDSAKAARANPLRKALEDAVEAKRWQIDARSGETWIGLCPLCLLARPDLKREGGLA